MSSTADFEVVVAVKRLTDAKTRLAPALSAPARSRPVLAMLSDTLLASLAVPDVAHVTVVTPDGAVADVARRVGARVLLDPTPPTHPDPLDQALGAAEARVRTLARNVAVLQGDLPALRCDELTEAITAARSHGRSFVSDRHGDGTSASALLAVDVALDPSFGPGSARRHRESRAVELTGSWRGLRCDVDTLDDLEVARGVGVGPATSRELDVVYYTSGSNDETYCLSPGH